MVRVSTRLSPRRLFAQRRNVHVAEIGEHQRARDRRRREHQEVDGLALARERQPLMHAEAMLLVDDRQRQIVERDLVLEQRVGADQKIDVARRQRRQDFRALAAALAAGENGDADADGGGERRDGGKVLARQNLGRRHDRRLPAGFDHVRGGQQRHHRLARADIAVKQPQHALRLRQIGDDVGDGALLRWRQRVGQGGENARAQAALGGAAAAGAGALMGAKQRERKLPGEQFVVGEPRPRRALRPQIVGRFRAMDAAQRIGKARKAVALEPFGVLPFGQIFRHALQRRVDRLAHLVGMQPFGQRIDRIDQRQTGKARLIDHAIRVNHLQMAVVERGDARHVAHLADRKELFQIVPARVEIGDGQRVGVVAGFDVVGRARAVRRRRTMALHRDGDRHHRIGHDLAQFRLAAAVDEAGRQMEQQVDNPRLSPSRASSRANNFSSFGPMPGRFVSEANSGLRSRRAHRDLTSSLRRGSTRQSMTRPCDMYSAAPRSRPMHRATGQARR